MDSFSHHNRRPDIAVIDEESKSVILNEICNPYDCHMTMCYEGKFNKYFPLWKLLKWATTEVIVLLIGSMGSVDKRFVSVLKKITFLGQRLTI